MGERERAGPDGVDDPALPLDGVRVLELGYGVAAPVCCRNLAQFGADVIRVESVRRPDSLRQVGAGWVPLDTDWEVLRDTGSLLHFTSAGKRSIGLELDRDEGRAIFARLVAASDALVMNVSVEAVEHLGLGYAEMRRLNPGLVWINMPSFGAADGPYRTYRTWGRNIAAMAGPPRLVGWPDRDPVGMGVNLPDYLSALWATIAVVCALTERDTTGEGCEIDLSQYQAAMSCIGPVVMEAVLGGDGLGTLGNRAEGWAPQGVYPVRGSDRWVAVSVMDADMWHGMCSLRGLERLGADERFATVAGRLEHREELDEAIASWTGSRTGWEVAAELQAVGVAASPVLDSWGVLSDPQLEARQHFHVVPHARFGGELTYGQAIRLTGTPATFTRAAPAFGEDTRDVLRAVAGLSDAAVESALASGVVHEMTRPDLHFERPYLHWIRAVLPLDWPPSTIVDPAAILFERLRADAEPDPPAPDPIPPAPEG
jgi:crotonobetainyl-CoA:carnitine CoA-transferase CaiB-like acyl-CoA transferase